MNDIKMINEIETVEEFEKFIEEKGGRISLGTKSINFRKFGYYQVPLIVFEYIENYLDKTPKKLIVNKCNFAGTIDTTYLKMNLENKAENYDAEKVEKRLLNIRQKIRNYNIKLDLMDYELKSENYQNLKLDLEIDRIRKRKLEAQKEIEQLINEYVKQLNIEF